MVQSEQYNPESVDSSSEKSFQVLKALLAQAAAHPAVVKASDFLAASGGRSGGRRSGGGEGAVILGIIVLLAIAGYIFFTK